MTLVDLALPGVTGTGTPGTGAGRSPAPAGGGVAATLPVVALLALLTTQLVAPEAVLAAAPALAVGGLVLGLPHGAVDHLVALRLAPAAPPGRGAAARRLVIVLVGYVAVAALAASALLTVPTAALAVFLVVSALHFGAGESAWWAERSGRPVPGLRAAALPTVAVGGAVVGLPYLAWPSTSGPVLGTLAPGFPLAPVALRTPLVGVVLTVVALAAVTLHRRSQRAAAAELVLVAAVFLLVPPLAAFGVWFGGWHAVRHTARLLPRGAAPRVALASYARDAAAPTLVAAAALALVAGARADSDLLAAGLAVLLALTAPHVLVTAALDRSRGGPPLSRRDWSRTALTPAPSPAPVPAPVPVRAPRPAGG